ncbi:uncharacterized protein LOC126802438 [Argentina anserina]|uniref:uncharacterized protein LOC126802438 n=1 Tax=Argentina anserina TaxID=57926 RepID=UPI0021763519|nr:uncharacterized protein LOC126802438 [Potentilla anserina]XP_050386023.1 uncharacterized protein LOC126802438 [Potentilla anserina]
MKKLFFFRSSGSSNGHNKSPPSTDKQVSDIQNSSESAGLRRSRSLSSAAFLVSEPVQAEFSSTRYQSRSPCRSASSKPHWQCGQSSCCQSSTPEGHQVKQFEVPAVYNTNGLERPGSVGSPRIQHGSSGSSSTCSSNVSSKVLDRYIDGDQEESGRQESNASHRNLNGNGNGGGWRPPRVHITAPSSPRAHSFREAKSSRYRLSSKDWTENGFGHDSPRRLAKNVVERLSQSHVMQPSHAKEFDHDIPLTIEDIYGRSDSVSQKTYPLDDPYDHSSMQKQFYGENCNSLNSDEIGVDLDVELQRRLEEAEEKVMLLSEELEQESFLRDTGYNVPSLIQTIRDLTEQRVSFAIEVSNLLQLRIAERASAKKELRLAKAELESRTRRLEKEKNELQSALETELDRRSTDWSLKLDKYQSEEQRLRERVRELAEQNVSLQREVSSFHVRETESKSFMTNAEQQLQGLTTRMEEMREENQGLQENLAELQEKYRASEEDRICLSKNYEDRDKECKDLHKSITRLLRTCKEQEKTIEGLREGFSEEFRNSQSSERFDKHVLKLQMEQMRLTGIELGLRRELESQRLEVDSLRHENIHLLDRLRGNEKNSGALTFKLDKEMWARVGCLQNQGLSLLNESSQLCSDFLHFVKGKAGQLQEAKQGLDAQFLVESEMKVQGLKRGTETLTRSLQKMSALFHEKSNLAASKYQSKCTDASESEHPNDQTPEDDMRYKLQSETILTSLLREKIHSKELEVEQLQAELAAAVRGNDILRCEVQNAMDNLSCLTHKLKDVELLMLKKDDNINKLQSDLQESRKELTITRGILPKISEERDMMWEEVKKYNEKNMLLNSEVNLLKKKIETLDEEVLFKEGQITILKDTIGNKPFDLLASPDNTREYLLR